MHGTYAVSITSTLSQNQHNHQTTKPDTPACQTKHGQKIHLQLMYFWGISCFLSRMGKKNNTFDASKHPEICKKLPENSTTATLSPWNSVLMFLFAVFFNFPQKNTVNLENQGDITILFSNLSHHKPLCLGLAKLAERSGT